MWGAKYLRNDAHMLADYGLNAGATVFLHVSGWAVSQIQVCVCVCECVWVRACVMCVYVCVCVRMYVCERVPFCLSVCIADQHLRRSRDCSCLATFNVGERVTK